MLSLALRQVRRFRGVMLTAPLLLVAGWLVFGAMGLRLTSHARADPDLAGYLRRVAANFTGFETEVDSNVATADNGQGGTVIYDQNVLLGDAENVMYVTVSGTGDSHHSVATQLSCSIDGVVCNPGFGAGPTGWVTVQRFQDYNLNFAPGGTKFNGDSNSGGAGDLHDNNINYTWCFHIPGNDPGGMHNVKVRLGKEANSSDPKSGTVDGAVFMETVHFFVDASQIRDPNFACAQVPTVSPFRVKPAKPGQPKPARQQQEQVDTGTTGN